ncbi:ABC transporter substrate-binding protein [Roseateles oligotrophus]|uniref:ABC transporter substrate-binding protein n=1 Tax=Roseateles oligotrophus TaxID=1769250 RepID=A0ABT2YKG1_9BURK|nr:ABC transporter substrate-binding protein [Roseateles oligotrophus]MCV2370405.1 ABC transporter substrate-binding protein [Roseateles oligotrophus]
MLGKRRNSLTIAAAIGLAAAASAGIAAESTFIGAFDVGPAGNAQKFNPLTASAGFSFYNKYFSTLTLYDVGLQKVAGDLAQSWHYSADGKTLTIKLRQGVKWHDGKPLSARDVKFTLEMVQNPDMASVFASRLGAVADIKAADDATVVLALSAPDATLPDAFTNIMILPEHLLGKLAAKDLRSADWWKSPVGTGPYKWNKYLPDQYVELTANASFYRGKPKLDKLINRYFKDGSSAAIALQAGEIQYSYLTLDQVRENEKNQAYKVVAGSSHVLNYIGVNKNDPRFKDVRIREAILLAIDRKAIVKSLYGGGATLGNCVLTMPKYVPADINHYETNVAQARTLLAQAGWDKLSKGEPIELLTYYNDQLSKDVVAALQFMLAQVGINLKPRFVDAPSFGPLVDAGKFSMVFAGSGNGPDPSALAPLLASAYAPPKGVNRMRVNSPEIDQLFQAGQRESDEGQRTEIYKNLCRVTNAQLPWIPLWVANRFGGFANNTQGVIWTPAPGGGRYQDLPETWSLR